MFLGIAARLLNRKAVDGLKQAGVESIG